MAFKEFGLNQTDKVFDRFDFAEIVSLRIDAKGVEALEAYVFLNSYHGGNLHFSPDNHQGMKYDFLADGSYLKERLKKS